MTAHDDHTRYLASWQDEQNSATLYRALADAERDPKIAEVYRRLAEVEQRHADAWAERLRAAGETVPPFQPSFRTRVLSGLARRFSVELVLPSITTLEQIGSHDYSQHEDARSLVGEERSHARLLQSITRTTRGGLEGGAVAQIEGRHRAVGGNALRAAVLGANDGLVSNLSLVMGVAGAELSNQAILITGMAGLLAGACSMALGEWLSVQSSRELYQRQISIEAGEIASAPAEEAEELALIYQARGLDETRARQLSDQIIGNQEIALETLVREELGINPKELGGSAWEAAITSFVLFAIGAIVPVIPYIFLSGMFAVSLSVALSMVGLFIIGASTSLFTGKTVLFSGARQVSFGVAAAAITFGLGRLLGVSLGG